MQSVEEIARIAETVIEELDESLTEILIQLNQSGKLEDFLEMIGLEDLLQPAYPTVAYKTAKILVLGDSQVNRPTLLAIAKKLNIDKDRFDMYLKYEQCKSFDASRIRYGTKYALVIAGPMPHKTNFTGSYSSAIEAMKQQSGYPPVLEAREVGGVLKLTKTSWRNVLMKAIDNNLIVTNAI